MHEDVSGGEDGERKGKEGMEGARGKIEGESEKPAKEGLGRTGQVERGEGQKGKRRVGQWDGKGKG